MLTGELRSKIDGVWNAFWAGGIANPLEVIEQITYRTAGPASANLQGRKPREGIRWWCGVRYGDLSAASAVADCGRRDCGSCARAKRCMNRHWLASNAVGTCPI